MGTIFSLDADTKSVIQDVLDDFLIHVDDGGLSKSCRLVYPPRNYRCDNCVYDAINNRSSNRPSSGAAMPFPPGGGCPMCGGKGLVQQEMSEVITLKCNWEFKSFPKFITSNLDFRKPYSIVQTKGYITDLPKILKAQHIVVNLPIEPYIRQSFTLYGEPGDPSNLVPGRYFDAFWSRM